MTQDKKLHAIAGAGIAFVVTLLVVLMTTALAPMLPLVLHSLSQPVPAALLALLAGERAGWVKEYVWDASGKAPLTVAITSGLAGVPLLAH